MRARLRRGSTSTRRCPWPPIAGSRQASSTARSHLEVTRLDRPARRPERGWRCCGDRAGARRRGHARERVVRRRRGPEPRQPAHRHRRLRRGCIAGAVPLPADGPGWQVMRPSRNRAWGHPTSSTSSSAWPRGQSLTAGRASWSATWASRAAADAHRPRLAPDRARRRRLAHADARPHAHARRARGTCLRPSPCRTGVWRSTRRFGRGQAALWSVVRRCSPRSSRPSSTRPSRGRCRGSGRDRGWLAKVRPWYGHDDHMHVRLRCPADEPLCRDQDPPPRGETAAAPSWPGGSARSPTRRPRRPGQAVTLVDLPPPAPVLRGTS